MTTSAKRSIGIGGTFLRHASALLFLALICILSPSTGRAAAGPRAPLVAAPGGPIGAADLQAFLDDEVPAQLAAGHIPGAAVAVVAEGRMVFAKGYGDADRETGQPVAADRTLFRLGSVDKPFVATAVMQLVERGKLDLDADVNTYLTAFKIPATYPQPITLAHLLTHTAGFEDRAELARTADDLLPPGKYLAEHLPARVRPPGELAVYSNPGWTLAGYIVAQVAGMPFEQYVEEHILGPLGMSRTTFRQPVPANLAPQVAVGYTFAGDAYRPGAFEYVQGGPSGEMSATATDMAAFAIAQLQRGRFGATRILQEASADEMQRRRFGNSPQVSGLTLGFEERQLNGQRLLWKDGDTTLFASGLALLPERNVALFVAYNGPEGKQARRDLLQALLDRYYPADPVPTRQPPADFRARAGRFTGTYRSARIPTTTFAKLQGLFDTVHVSATEDGFLAMPDENGTIRRWVEVAPLLFRAVDGLETRAFRADSQGRITHLLPGNEPTEAFARIAWYEAPPVHLGLLASSLLLLLSALFIFPVALLRNRRRATGAGAQAVLSTTARGLAAAVGALQLLFIAGLMATLSNPTALAYGAPPLLIAALGGALAGAVLTCGMVVCAVLAWRGHSWGLVARMHYTAVALAGVAFVVELSYWNLLGFHF